MQPELVLMVEKYRRLNATPETQRDLFIYHYRKYAEKYPEVQELAAKLILRVQRACKIINMHFDCSTQGKEERCADNLSLEGDFPLGNESDASYAYKLFNVEQTAAVQLGLYSLIEGGDSDYPVTRARRAFLAELNGEWETAASYYSKLSDTASKARYTRCLQMAKKGVGGQG